MKKLVLIGLLINAVVYGQISIDSLVIDIYPDTSYSCSEDTLCSKGAGRIFVSNYSSSYKLTTYYGNDTNNIIDQFYNNTGTISISLCYDSIIIEVLDTSNGSSSTMLILPDSLICPLDTLIPYHPSIPLLTEFNYGGVGGGDTVLLNVLGGHKPGYLYYLDSISNKKCYPDSIYTIWEYRKNNHGIFDSVPAGWYGVRCFDTSVTKYKRIPKANYFYAECDTLKSPDTLLFYENDTNKVYYYDTIPQLYGKQLIFPWELNIFTTTLPFCPAFTGYPYYTSLLASPGGVFHGYKYGTTNINYLNKRTGVNGNQPVQCSNIGANAQINAELILEPCDTFEIWASDEYSSKVFSDTVEFSFRKNNISRLNLIDIDTSRLGSCCDGSLTFSISTTPNCDNDSLNYIEVWGTSGLGLVYSDTIYKDTTITIENLCPGYYQIDDGFCERDFFSILMNDYPCDSSSSINKILYENLFEIYPNPFQDDIKIIYTGEYKRANANYCIYTINGELIQEGRIKGQESVISLNALNEGSYFIKIFSDNGSAIKRIVKM